MTERGPSVHLSRDVPRSVVGERMRDGSWVRVRRGAYASGATGRAWQRRRHRALAAAAAVQRQVADAVLSHDTAALVHGLAV